MIDTSNFTIDTPVLIKIMSPIGVDVPELHTRIPVESYASIDQIIGIMNRGIVVTFPKESNLHEISKKIEDIMLDYKAKVEIAEEKGHIVENNIDTALDTISEMNNSSLTEKEQEEEFERHIFEYPEIIERIYKDLRGNELDNIFNTDDFKKGVDRIKQAEIEHKAWERVHNFKKQSLKERSNYDKAFVDFHKYLIPKDDTFFTDNEDIEFSIN